MLPTYFAHFRVWCTYIVDSAVYPVMAASYMLSATQISDEYRPYITELIVLLIILIRLAGFDVLVKFSTVLTVVAMCPVLIYIGFMIPHADPKLWVDSVGSTNCTTINETIQIDCQPMETEWSQLLPFVMWLWSGFFSISSIAGQV